MTNADDIPTARVSSKCVVYIGGFDPRGASYYYKLFAQQIDKYVKKHDSAAEVGPRRRSGKHWFEWTVITSSPGYAESVNIRLLVWDDIIRKHWVKSRWQLFLKACRTYYIYLKTGGLYHCFRMTWYPMVIMLYPALSFIALYFVLMLTCGLLFSAIAKGMLSSTHHYNVLAGMIGAIFGAGVSHFLSPRLNGGYILRSFSFNRRLAEGPLPELEERLNLQVPELVEHLAKTQPDELLVITHSSGSIISIRMLEKLFDAENWKGRVSLLTLGGCIPLTSFLGSQNGFFNTSLRQVALNPNLDWIDFTMPSDGACFAMLDPVRATFSEPIHYPNTELPKFLSARFMEGYSPSRYKELKKNRYLFHFLYLMTPDRQADFDLYATMLGDKRLSDRFKHRTNQARNPAP